MSRSTLSKTYNRDYFDGGKGYSQYSYSGQFEKWAAQLIERFTPASVLDVGCAKGFLVQAFRDRGVEAWGVDASEYAVSQAPEGIAEYLYHLDITSQRQIKLPPADLVCSFDTFEHIPEDKLKQAKEFMISHGQRYFIRVATPNTPDWQHDPTHITIKPLEFWREFWGDCVFDESI